MKLSGLCVLAVAAAVIALSEAEDCPSNGEKKLLPHETDCYKYYECTGTGKVLKDCAFIGDKRWCFDKAEQACVLPNENCCKDDPGNGDNGSCPNNSKCKMYFTDDVVEVCVKKASTSTLSKLY